jgi:hypothetical protein
MLLLYFLPLLFKVWQRSGSFCCYTVFQYRLRFDRGLVHVVVILSTIAVKVWQRSGSCCCYIVYHYCLRYDREVVHVVVVILSTTTV